MNFESDCVEMMETFNPLVASSNLAPGVLSFYPFDRWSYLEVFRLIIHGICDKFLLAYEALL